MNVDDVVRDLNLSKTNGLVFPIMIEQEELLIIGMSQDHVDDYLRNKYEHDKARVGRDYSKD